MHPTHYTKVGSIILFLFLKKLGNLLSFPAPAGIDQMAAAVDEKVTNIKSSCADIDSGAKVSTTAQPFSLSPTSYAALQRGALSRSCLAHAQNRRRINHLNTQGYPDPRRDDIVIRDSVLDVVLDVMWGMGWILQLRGISLSLCNCISSSSTFGCHCIFSDACVPFCYTPCDFSTRQS